MTYARALQIRRHAVDMGLAHLVLETDAPDIPPAWLHEPERRNAPHELARIADVLAELRGIPREDAARATTGTALRVLPRLRALYIA
jgi:TatD DNase family protein